MALDPAIVVAGIAVVPALIGGGMGAYASLKQRGNENLNIVIAAMRDHMNTLAGENADMRTRLGIAEGKTNDALMKLVECETSRKNLQREVDDLKQRMTNAESRDSTV